MRDSDARRAAIVIGLFVALFGVRFVLDDPTYIGATFLLVLPTVLAALWFGVQGGVAVAVTAAVAFFIAERLDPSMEAELHTVVWAAVVRLGALTLVAVLVARLFDAPARAGARARRGRGGARGAAPGAGGLPRPDLELAAHYVPAEQGVGGDFFLTAEGPRGSTVLLVGDVVGKGVRGGAAGGVRAHVAGDVRAVRGRSGAAAAARERGADRPRGDVGRLRDGGVRGAPAGGCDARVGDRRAIRRRCGSKTGRRSDSAGAGQPLGLEVELDVSSSDRAARARRAACCSTPTGSRMRATCRAERFGEERLRSLVAAHGRESAAALVEHLRAALAAYAPAGRRRRVPARGEESGAVGSEDDR